MADKKTSNSHKRSQTGTGMRRLASPVRRKKPSLAVRMLRRLPGWVRWAGGLCIAGLYVAFFYFIFVSPHGFRWRALYGSVNYPVGYDIHGIDVSHYQGIINWELLRNQGRIDECPISFVIIKATEGSTQTDQNFERNYSMAREYGFLRGAYHFYTTQSSAADQARFFFSKVKLEKGDLPPVLDVEKKPRRQDKEAFKQGVLQWLRMAERYYGVKPILYTNYKFKLEYLNDSIFNQYPYWIAHYYVDSVEYQGQWKFWQHTDEGQLPGIKGNVDFNIYNGSYYDLQQMAIKN